MKGAVPTIAAVVVTAVALAGAGFFWPRAPADRLQPRVAIVPGAAVPVTARQRARVPFAPLPSATPTPPERDLAADQRRERDRINRNIIPLLETHGGKDRLLHDRLVSERRDEQWAPVPERDLRSAFLGLKDVGGTMRLLDVQCAATICQVTEEFADPEGENRRNPTLSWQGWAGLASVDLNEMLAARGYDWQSMDAGSGADGRPIFVSFFLRATPVSSKALPARSAPNK